MLHLQSRVTFISSPDRTRAHSGEDSVFQGTYYLQLWIPVTLLGSQPSKLGRNSAEWWFLGSRAQEEEPEAFQEPLSTPCSDKPSLQPQLQTFPSAWGSFLGKTYLPFQLPLLPSLSPSSTHLYEILPLLEKKATDCRKAAFSLRSLLLVWIYWVRKSHMLLEQGTSRDHKTNLSCPHLKEPR